MRRVSVLIAAVLACAIISATPAVAQEATAAPQTVEVVHQAVPMAGGAHQNWFWDWNTCIWGIGVPAGVAWVIVTTPQTWASVNRLRSIPGVGWYVPRVVAACGRFIRS